MINILKKKKTVNKILKHDFLKKNVFRYDNPNKNTMSFQYAFEVFWKHNCNDLNVNYK